MITTEQLIILKAKVKAEMLRRSGYGSIAQFGSSEFDFNEQPRTGEIIKEEHGKKVIDPLLQIKDHGDLVLVNKGDPIPDSFDSELIGYVDRLAAEPMTGSNSSCRGACTGLCYGSCTTSCTGCSGSCSSQCVSCSNTCDTSCSGCSGCSSGCAAGCNGCTATCGSGCESGCRY